MKKILVTGGNGRFSAELKKIKKKFKFIFLGKTQLDILDPKSINKALKKYKPDSLLHLAGLSRPMSEHEKNISKSIKLNIIGTSNLVIECANLNIKLIYFSTSYVYPGVKGNYANVASNFIYQTDLAKIFLKVLNKKGIINLGGKSQTIYKFVKKNNKKISKIFSKGEFPLKQDMNLNKLKKNIK